jgi:hypothetical protein
MSHRGSLSRAWIFMAAFSLSSLGAPAAFASDPLPGDGIAPPLNINIALFYEEFQDAGTFGATHGANTTEDTHISDEITVLRYVRTFSIGGMEAGLQAYLPLVNFIGTQQLGIQNIPSPVAGFPAFGPGKANLSNHSGFAEPSLGAFAFPVNNPATGTYVAIGPWIDPPISSFNKNYVLNPAQNVWVVEPEAGFRTILNGTPTTKNLAIEVWGEGYFYGDNNNSEDVSPEVSANNIPAIYTLFGVHNPLQNQSGVPATFREQPSAELRVYLPYEFAPALGAYFAPGFYQSFGGKQTYKLGNGTVVDSGNRTNESQLRFILASFLSPTLQVMAIGEYDVAAHGAPLNRNFELRIAKFF